MVGEDVLDRVSMVNTPEKRMNADPCTANNRGAAQNLRVTHDMGVAGDPISLR